MAGRSRGKPAMSFSMEQLGISKGETLPASVLQPSPSYPPLDHKPLPIQLTTEMSYLVELKRDFTDYMRESPNNVQAAVLNEDVERFYEDFEETIAERNKSEYETRHDWNIMPMELKLSRKRKSQQQNTSRNKKKKEMDIIKKLAELEKKEDVQRPEVEEEGKEEGDEDEDGEEKETGEGAKDEEEIDEMDDGTDYVNEYFENGDNYYSEDDNDDDQFF
ncbi:DNA-directed RNA polymerase III subunit RPC7-like [Pogonomyrmex barbatus]|uniref:DNA-directed RNA polymerase III subunit RPC7-like n=1 Tax=Pogonomyrmex barbatus TaxID=144034 RepID=A0A6I9W6Y8_9HYME|nr:DNA-directed RNA polymerase III subunit RPC7-like [Pogonomyrmex barbatus]